MARTAYVEQRREKTKAILIVFVLLLAPFLLGQGYPERTPTIGGAGGGTTQSVCPMGTFLTGLSAQIGRQMNHIVIWCTAIRPDGRWAGQPFLGPSPGMGSNTGASWSSVSCPRNSFIYGFYGTVYLYGASGWQDEGDPFNTYVASANFNCYFPTTKSRYGIGLPSQSPHWTESHRYRSRNGFECKDLATGIRGQSGIYVDSLGLTCAPFTAQPRSDCLTCHQGRPWSSMRSTSPVWALAVLIPTLFAVGWAFVKFSPGSNAFPVARTFNKFSLLTIAAVCTTVGIWARKTLIDSVHAPWWPEGTGVAVLVTIIVGLGVAAVARLLLAKRHRKKQGTS